MTESCGSSRNGLGMDCWTVGILFFSAAGEKQWSPGEAVGVFTIPGSHVKQQSSC